MPYTENTRIKVVSKRTHKTYAAQVEYRYPFTKFTTWVDFEDTHDVTIAGFLGFNNTRNAASFAICEASRLDKGDKLKGLVWAQAIIDKYHEVIADRNHKDTVEYIKYP